VWGRISRSSARRRILPSGPKRDGPRPICA
jgi:hypothetical protein